MDYILLIARDGEVPNTSTSIEEKYVSIIKDRLDKSLPNKQFIVESTYAIPNGRAFNLYLRSAIEQI